MSEKRVSQLVQKIEEVEWVGPHTPVREAVRRLGRQRRRGCEGVLLVVSQDQGGEEILGTLSLEDILAKLEPSPPQGDDLPIFWQGQFQDRLRMALQGKVEEYMSPLRHALNQGSTLMEALHLMNLKKTRLLVVMQGESVVGILTREHLVREVVALANGD